MDSKKDIELYNEYYQLAKLLGGKRLTGHIRMKIKAERIRRELLTKFESDAEYLLTHKGATHSAVFIQHGDNLINKLREYDVIENEYKRLQELVHSDNRDDGEKRGVLAGHIGIAYYEFRNKYFNFISKNGFNQ